MYLNVDRTEYLFGEPVEANSVSSDEVTKDDTLPVFGTQGTSSTTKIHLKKPGGTKYEEILNNLMTLLEKFPDYKIYVTGHSLGASLSTLFGFVLASDHDSRIPKPIKCITIASPRVGNIAFRRAFQVCSLARP